MECHIFLVAIASKYLLRDEKKNQKVDSQSISVGGIYSFSYDNLCCVWEYSLSWW